MYPEPIAQHCSSRERRTESCKGSETGPFVQLDWIETLENIVGKLRGHGGRESIVSILQVKELVKRISMEVV